MNNKEVINTYLIYLKEDMVKMYNPTNEEMDCKIKDFNFLEMIETEPDAVMHFDSSYWADMIYHGKSLIHS